MTKINYTEEFELMRPYRDEEVQPALRRLTGYPAFDIVLSYLFPDRPLAAVKEMLLKLDTVDAFQAEFMYHAVNSIVNKTSNGLSVSGQENLKPGEPYLFISNHRDIVLDAAILQVLLLDNGHKTSQITFGSNLMTSPLVVDFGKLNRMFTFYREGSRIQMYRNSLLHSAYISDAILQKQESVWIAQRNGRTKDGNDLTQLALLKMLGGYQPDSLQTLTNLNIVPMAVSYEYEPCDIEKTREIYLSGRQEYVKEKDEDLKSVLSGITSPKGRIHFSFGTPLNSFLENLKGDALNLNGLSEATAAEMDRQIHHMFRLFPNNYIASDMLSGKQEFAANYTGDELSRFSEYVSRKTGGVEGDKDELRKLFLNLYARPVLNRFPG
ncbi:MAG: 1-acyl-sn-glycerol-3-phosphate acyltransferase [Bacteroidales bacterium]|nr:1-acyl-sn-glycerol-3-phosphate acyltransferase [Bacteroidales bacterium]